MLLALKLFKGMQDEQLAILLDHAELIDYMAADYIIREGEQGQHLFVIIAGQVDICKRVHGAQKVIQRLGPGEAFGEMSLIECRARCASVRAATPCKALRIDGGCLDKLPDIALRIYRNIAILLSQRLRQANEIIALSR
ncbi:cyclic nucleotide-binding domain-containing protein [Massilia sp. W12]|uniref:cyclic nucleotide-binding domain-containing protein n=1 Tax=Massilia sp. W12 TaxID=3126507 RepID=UPI0030D02119